MKKLFDVSNLVENSDFSTWTGILKYFIEYFRIYTLKYTIVYLLMIPLFAIWLAYSRKKAGLESPLK